MYMPSRSLKWQRVAAVVTAAGLTIALIGEMVNMHQIVAFGYAGLTMGVVPLITATRRKNVRDRDIEIEGAAFALAVEILCSGELDRTAKSPRHNNT